MLTICPPDAGVVHVCSRDIEVLPLTVFRSGLLQPQKKTNPIDVTLDTFT